MRQYGWTKIRSISSRLYCLGAALRAESAVSSIRALTAAIFASVHWAVSSTARSSQVRLQRLHALRRRHHCQNAAELVPDGNIGVAHGAIDLGRFTGVQALRRKNSEMSTASPCDSLTNLS